MHLLKQPPRLRRLPLVIGGDGESGASLDDTFAAPANRDETAARSASTPAAIDAVEAEPQVSDTVQQAHELARRKGFKKGYQEGVDAGYLKGLEEGKAAGDEARRAEVEQKTAQLDVVLNTLTRPLETLKEDMIAALTEGSLELARLLVGAALEVDPSALAGVARDIIEEAQAAGAPNHVLRLQVPLASHAAIKALAEPYGAEVCIDEKLDAGDVLAELSRVNGDPVQRIEWDARLNTRWDTIRKTFER